MQTQPQSKKPTWLIEWYLAAVAVTALVLLFLASAAHGAVKKIDDLGLALIDRVKVIWPTVHCDEWPEKDGTYKCSGTFYVHANGIKANKK